VNRAAGKAGIQPVVSGGRHSFERRDHAVMLRKFFGDEGGATAIEYGMIAALIAVALIGTLKVVGTQLDAKFGTIAVQLN
jgi:pilus assembly protein Flp/PilA